jgi:hypothetical protein
MMTPEMAGTLAAAPLALGGALIMRWFETRSRSSAWRREDRQRFLQDKRRAYSQFLASCQWLVENRSRRSTNEFWRFRVSAQSVLLLAPKNMVGPAQDLSILALKVAATATPSAADVQEWGSHLAKFMEAARTELGSDVGSSER